MIRRSLASTTLAFGLVLTLAGVAGAHSELDPDEGGPGLQVEVRLHVENERADAATVTVELALPASPAVPIVAIPEVAGWTASQLPAAASTGPRVVWEGGPERDAAELPIVLGPLPDTEQRLQFKVLQTYDDGEVVRWIDDWPAGAPEPANPGPVLDVVTGGPGTAVEPVATTTAAPTTTTPAPAPTPTPATSIPAASTALTGSTAPASTSLVTTATTALGEAAPATTTAAPSTPPEEDEDDGANTWAFVALGALVAGAAALVARSARRPSR